MIEQTMIQLVTGQATFPPLDADTTAAVAAALQTLQAVGDRIRPNQARSDDAYPVLVYSSSTQSDPSPLLSGKASGWLEAEWEVAAVSDNYLQAQQIGNALAAVLQNFVNAPVPNGDYVSYIQMQGASDDEQDQEGTDPLHIRTLTFHALYKPHA